MDWKKYNLMVLSIIFVCFAMSICMNLFIDPYDIFHLTSLGDGYTPNQRYNKMLHVLQNPRRYNAFLVGSSRMGVYSPILAHKFQPNYHFYNMSVFGGDAKDILLMLRYLSKHGIKVREIVMGIDLFPFLMTDNRATPAYRHYPEVDGRSAFSFYFDYLFQPSLYHSWIKLMNYWSTSPRIRFDFNHTGQFYLLQLDRQIKTDPVKYIRQHFRQEQRPPVEVAFVQEKFRDLARLKDWLAEMHIKGVFFIHPHTRLELNAFADDVYPTFVSRIRNILGNIPDFTHYADWKTNYALYYDKIHYRRLIADKIMSQLFAARPNKTMYVFK